MKRDHYFIKNHQQATIKHGQTLAKLSNNMRRQNV